MLHWNSAGFSFPTQKRNRIFASSLRITVALAILLSTFAAAVTVRPAYAAANLTITPITWNVVGLDSNNVSVGPENFPVGARVCNTGDAAATNLSADFVWDSSNTYINLRTGSLDPITLSSLANGACHDFYFEITVTRSASAYNQTRDYHITVTADGGLSASTPANREIYVEKLVSQNRNSVMDVQVDSVSVSAGGTINLNIGQTYTIRLVASTATNGYEQIESFINFPNTIFLVNSVTTSYTAYPTPHTDSNYATKLYADGCSWVNDTTDPDYHTNLSCSGVGKYGDTVIIDYNVTIIASSTGSGTLNTLIYDYSGSSYHYNSDFALSLRYYNILDPNACTQSTIAQWTFPTDGTNLTVATDNAVGTPTLAKDSTINGPYDVAGNPTRSTSFESWSTAATLNTASDFVTITASTEGYYNVQLSFDAERSNQGPSTVEILYYDGTLTNPAGTDSIASASTWYAISEDFASVPSLDDYSGAYFRIYGYNASHVNGALHLDNVTVSGCKLPATLNLGKSANKNYYIVAGESITYTYTLTNGGQVSIQSPYTITDDKISSIDCSAATSPLTPGSSTTCTASYTVTAADVTAGSITNNASADATTIIGDAVSSNTAQKIIPLKLVNFGHLPSNYLNMNLYADNGAMHETCSSTRFGDTVTTATDGINTASYTPKSSDDGVTYTPSVSWTLVAGGSLDITATCTGGDCYLNAWMDWTKDGDFNDTGEQIFSNQILNTGTVTLTFPIPAGTTLDGTFYSRFRIYDYQPSPVSPSGHALDNSTLLCGEVEDPFFTVTGGVVTPVTVSYFKAERSGGQVQFHWSTATETGNLGFNLYVQRGGDLVQVNADLIPSNAVDSLDRQDYEFSASAGGSAFYIEDVSVTGETRRHGPFKLGEEFGSLLETDKVDWAAVSADQPAVPLRPGFAAARGNPTALNLKVRQTGMYRVTYEMLRDAGLDLAGAPAASLILTLRGKAQPIYISTTAAFGPGAYIEFYGRALDTIYTDTNVYTLTTSAARPVRIAVNNNAIPRGVTPAASYMETLTVNNQRAYANYSPSADAWYDTALQVATTPKSWDFQFNVNGLAGSSASSTLELTLWGVTNWPQAPDHHVQVSVNGNAVADVAFDGLSVQVVNVNLPAGALVEGLNTLRVTMPGDTGVRAELVNLDKFKVTYPRKFQARDGRLAFTASGEVFRVTNLPGPNVTVYQVVNNRPVRLGKFTVRSGANNTYFVTFPGSAAPTAYIVSTVETMYAPALAALPAIPNLDQPADYLIISHPNFIGGLQPLIQARQAQGLTVSVVNVNDLYNKYAYGVFDPKAIKTYIAHAAQNLGVRYVLLVGGDTYDYRNYLGVNSVSFIPSLYVSTGPLVKFVPADPLYADLNGDKVPDLAIGRFPVRTQADLELMIGKTLAYQNKDYGRTALFASDRMDGMLSFKGINTEMSGALPSGWTSESVSLDEKNATDARAQLLDAMNRGVSLVTYTGHSAADRWTFSGLFNKNYAAALTNAGRPFVAVQWGCWNTYYVEPVNTTLVQSLLFSGDRGAAAVLGASTLTDSQSEKLLGQLLTPRLVARGATIGQALRDAKLELAQTHPELLDVLLGWSLMGDPALVIDP